MNASMRTDRVGPKVADRYLGAERRDRPREPGLATLPQFAAAPNRDAIRFAFGECSLGLILVAATAKGICAIWFGEDRNALARELQTCFPQAKQVGDNKDSDRLLAQVIGFVEAPAEGLDAPLDVRGTPFEQRVWQALRQIPAGSTASYGDIAARIGEPRAAVQVAEACASNVLAVAIPCHRVVRSDGTLSGYRWGVKRKRALLAREAAR